MPSQWSDWKGLSAGGVVRSFLAAWLFLSLSGCGSDQPVLVEVRGRVTFEGRGLTAGAITFHPAADNPFQSDAPSSQLQLDGSFRMRTWPWGDGVPPGNYQVTLSPELAGRIGRSRYADRASTPLTLMVPHSPVEGHEFRVDDP
ncbi:MAG: hypothetical protein ACKO2P_17555 [Planctomycetota bacterium]